MSEPVPDIERAAVEVKGYLDSKKLDLVDYGYVNIEAYPDPRSDESPELKKMAKEWSDFYDQVDKAIEPIAEETIEEMRKQASGKDVLLRMLDSVNPPLADLYGKLSAKLNAVASMVNEDAAYWKALRDVVVPLYEKSPHYEAWKERWKAVELAYDPISQETTTTQMLTNKKTGERHRGEVISRTLRPEGFIVRVM